MPASSAHRQVQLELELASLNRAALRNAGVLGVTLFGGPGCGKTSLIESTLQRIFESRFAIIVSEEMAEPDVQRLRQSCAQVIPANTGDDWTLTPRQMHRALGAIDLSSIDCLLIENAGTLIQPTSLDVGQSATVSMFSIGGGDDKATKHPQLVNESSLLLLNKIDLLPYVPFRREHFREEVRRLNPHVDVLEISTLTGEGLERWITWLMDKISRTRRPRPGSPRLAPESFVG